MSDVVIRRAARGDVDVLMEMYRAAQRWLASRGTDQWAVITDENTRDPLIESIERGECYVAQRGDQVIGTVTVDENADPEFWTARDCPASALYVHRMVVERSASGQNVGGRLLDWAQQLADSSDKQWLRLDAWRTNTALHAYYARQGFSAVRVVELEHRETGALFQRPAGVSGR
ncbi:GNAT family N-acetyltransferase [Actinoplanes sp. NPDC026623]|uniref:GNAT family N-acetyltransferase n=1 Tax=Actinoplanes sp. NPDC026623 TaxID=3155610 RepID=UPI003406020F